MNRRNRMTEKAWLAGVVLLILFMPAASSAGLGMGITPTKLHLSLEPGVTHTTTVEVSNTGTDPVRVVTYVVDWTTPREGGMSFLPQGEVARSASQWVDVDLSEFVLPPGESQIVRVTAALPDTARGSYWSLIFFEGEGATSRRGIGIGAKARMGTTVYLSASGTEERSDALTEMEIVRDAGSDTLRLVTSLANRGNVYYYPEGWFQVIDDEGAVVFEEKIPLRVLLPGRETQYNIPWKPTSNGRNRFVATFDSGLESLMQGVKKFDVEEKLPETQVPAIAHPPSPMTNPAPNYEPPAAAGSTRYGVHVESLAQRHEAEAAAARYASQYPVAIRAIDLGTKGTWHRIVVGEFAGKSEAKAFARKLADSFHLDYTMVVPLDS